MNPRKRKQAVRIAKEAIVEAELLEELKKENFTLKAKHDFVLDKLNKTQSTVNDLRLEVENLKKQLNEEVEKQVEFSVQIDHLSAEKEELEKKLKEVDETEKKSTRRKKKSED